MSEKTIEQKLSALRAEIANQNVDGYIIPRTDEWQNEYVPEACERLRWATGFTGSAGMALISRDSAVVLSDSRYEEQIVEQLDANSFPDTRIISREKGYAEHMAEWSGRELPGSKTVGYDPKLFTPKQLEKMKDDFAAQGVKLVALDQNPVDLAWSDRPDLPKGQVSVFPAKFAGQTVQEKCKAIGQAVKDAGHKAMLVNETDAIAWLLNMRGSDVDMNPVALATVLIDTDGGVHLMIDPDKLTDAVRDHLGADTVIVDSQDIDAALKSAISDLDFAPSETIAMDMNTTSDYFLTQIRKNGVTVKHMDSPVVEARAVKNDAEIDALKQAHVVDGVALVKMLRWVDETLPTAVATELTVEAKLQSFRAMHPDYQQDSFSTIAGWKKHGAVVHYRATPKSAKTITGSGLLLLDSGAQYCGNDIAGTTDITRTIAIGEPTDEMKEMFTRVLKGHIAVARRRFSNGTTGAQFDFAAREALHDINQDYGHGTGHGVGVYLAVHESGVGIHGLATKPLKPGQFMSNEPGYYKSGDYGIRIENLVLVEEDGKNAATGTLMMRFNTVSLAPIDARLIDASLLTNEELDWLNTYHKTVYDVLSVQDGLTKQDVEWLQAATAPILKP